LEIVVSGDEVEHELTRTERLLSLRSDLQDLEAALARVTLAVDGTDSGVLADDLEDAFVELDELGVTSLMTHAESASVASDSIGTLLDDRAGVAALRNGLRVASRLIGTILETGLHDWWEGARTRDPHSGRRGVSGLASIRKLRCSTQRTALEHELCRFRPFDREPRA
jgi:hypothetical protein